MNITDGAAVFAVRDKRMQALVDMFYPVGIVIAVANDNTPAFTKYGTWEKVGSGRVLWGADSSHTPGANIEAGLPNITGSLTKSNFTWGAVDNKKSGNALYTRDNTASLPGGTYNGIAPLLSFDASLSNAIYGKSTTVQPPAYVVNFWRRTA